MEKQVIDYLDGWIITYNKEAKQFRATTRDNAGLLFNDFKSNLVLKARNLETCTELIIKAKGEIETIKQLNNKVCV